MSTYLADEGKDGFAVFASQNRSLWEQSGVPAFRCPSDLDFGHLLSFALLLVFGQSLGTVGRRGNKAFDAVAQVLDAESGADEHNLMSG